MKNKTNKGKKHHRIVYILTTLLLIGGIMLGFLSYFGKAVVITTDYNLTGVSPEISDVLYYASLAPNSHNAQMWKITINPSEHKIKIFLDKERSLPAIDPENREAYISIGAYTQNLIEAFDSYGYKTNVEIGESENEPLVIISYENSSGIKSQEKLNRITLRHTDKSAYLSDKINKNDINQLLKGSSDTYYFSSDDTNFKWIKESTIKATESQSAKQDVRDELSKWLRLSDKETKEKKDGLPAEQIGLKGITKSIYYLFTTHESAVGDYFAEQGISTAKKQVNNCGGFFIITGENTVKGLIEAGMRFEKVWLDAVEFGISIQPMSQILEESPYNNEIQDKLGTTNCVQMVLRAGYVEVYGENNKVRRDLNDYITVE